MEHLLLKATTTATDEGVFEAVISSAAIDREKDIVDPHGMVRALAKWAGTGKNIPLAWNHSTRAADQIGHIDPSSARVAGDEVIAAGWIDQSTPVGADAWRLVKSGTLGFSFGYLALKGEPRKGGGRHIQELDVFEITATTTPMQPATRVLGWKAEKQVDDGSEDEDDPAELLGQMISLAQDFIDDEDDPQDVAAMREIMRRLLSLQGTEADETDTGKAVRLPAGASWLFPRAELKAVRVGELKAAWTTSYINDLPDSAFLYVAPGGSKDSDGKTTPRSLRYFPYKDASGAVDLPHLRNALARIPQSNLSASIKDQLTAKATRILNNAKSFIVDAADPETTRSRSADPLRRKADATALEHASAGESLKKPPRKQTPSKPAPRLELAELKRQMRETTLTALSGVDDSEPIRTQE
jgi:hypothetical protein